MKKRIFSAVIMAAILIPLLLLGGYPFMVGVGIIGLLAYKEILDIKGYKNYPIGVLVLGYAVMLSLLYAKNDLLSLSLNYKFLMFDFLIMFLPVVFYYDSGKYTYKDAFELTSFITFISIVLNLLMTIRLYNIHYFIVILLVTILTDTFAYFTGVLMGKHKVTKISPKKSLEGFIGGALFGSILTTIYYMYFIGGADIIKVLPVMLLLSLTCEVGDLFYSAIKRQVDIKDFSNLIPGHGGILDRIDSLTFVTMVFILLFGII